MNAGCDFSPPFAPAPLFRFNEFIEFLSKLSDYIPCVAAEGLF